MSTPRSDTRPRKNLTALLLIAPIIVAPLLIIVVELPSYNRMRSASCKIQVMP